MVLLKIFVFLFKWVHEYVLSLIVQHYLGDKRIMLLELEWMKQSWEIESDKIRTISLKKQISFSYQSIDLHVPNPVGSFGEIWKKKCTFVWN